MATHSGPVAWKVPWAGEPGGLQSVGSRRVRHDRATSLSLFTFMHWRRKWQPTPVFLPGESQGRWSLVGCRLWGRTGSDTTEATQQQQQHIYFFRLFSITGYYQILNIVPYAIQQILTDYMFYIQQCVSENVKLLIYPSWPFPFDNYKFVFHFCKSISALQISSFVSFFKIPLIGDTRCYLFQFLHLV